MGSVSSLGGLPVSVERLVGRRIEPASLSAEALDPVPPDLFDDEPEASELGPGASPAILPSGLPDDAMRAIAVGELGRLGLYGDAIRINEQALEQISAARASGRLSARELQVATLREKKINVETNGFRTELAREVGLSALGAERERIAQIRNEPGLQASTYAAADRLEGKVDEAERRIRSAPHTGAIKQALDDVHTERKGFEAWIGIARRSNEVGELAIQMGMAVGSNIPGPVEWTVNGIAAIEALERGDHLGVAMNTAGMVIPGLGSLSRLGTAAHAVEAVEGAANAGARIVSTERRIASTVAEVAAAPAAQAAAEVAPDVSTVVRTGRNAGRTVESMVASAVATGRWTEEQVQGFLRQEFPIESGQFSLRKVDVGHAFSEHGSDQAERLAWRAFNEGTPMGMWNVSREEAEAAVKRVLSKVPNTWGGTKELPLEALGLPPGSVKTLYPDGRVFDAKYVRIVSNGNKGVNTAYGTAKGLPPLTQRVVR